MENNESPDTDTIGTGAPTAGESAHARNAAYRQAWLTATGQMQDAERRGDTAAAERAREQREQIANDFVAANVGLAMSGVQDFLQHAPQYLREDYEQAALQGMWESFVGTNADTIDDIDIAEDGTVHAKAGWNPERATFGTASRAHIRGRVRRGVATLEAGMAYSTWTQRPTVLAVQRELSESLGRAPSVAEIAAKAKMTEEMVRTILTPRSMSLQTQLADGFTLEDTLAEEAADLTDGDELDADMATAVLLQAAQRMRPLDLFSLLLREGTIGRPALTEVEAGSRLGIGRGTVQAGTKRAAATIAEVVADARWNLTLWGLHHRRPDTVRLLANTIGLTRPATV